MKKVLEVLDAIIEAGYGNLTVLEVRDRIMKYVIIKAYEEGE